MRALYAGSFDPVHLGHMAVIEAAAARVAHLWVAVVGNPAKRSGLLRVPERRAALVQATSHLSNVEVVVHDGLTVDLAEHLGVDALVRARRTAAASNPDPPPRRSRPSW